jgi:hypothetical protein
MMRQWHGKDMVRRGEGASGCERSEGRESVVMVPAGISLVAIDLELDPYRQPPERCALARLTVPDVSTPAPVACFGLHGRRPEPGSAR